MSDDRSQHITIRFNRDYQFLVSFDDCEGCPEILVDEPPPLGDGAGPNPAALLAAAVGNCLAASLAFCLRKSRGDLADLTAHVVANVDRNDRGRFRITDIDVELEPVLASADGERFERCKRLFEDFCIVTESVRRGIPVNVTIRETTAALPSL